ncbi:MAG: Ku protein [Alphaproteobacteria bacterium]|jgi:DNA end-binding protein Ku|nr:Ku protein [Alphaproteobacteria bacterium]
MAARPFWRGHLKLSLVSCPVQLHSAVTEKNDIHLNFINPETGNRIRNQTIDAETEEVVSREDLVRGYQFAKDRYVTFTEDELADLRIESSSTMEIEKFVPQEDIPPVYFDKVYYITPDGEAGLEAFVVIREAMEKAGMLAISRVVLARKERAIAMKPEDKGIVAYSLREADDIKPEKEYFKDIDSPRVDKDMLEIAMRLVKQKSGHFDPDEYEDRYEQRMRDLIQAKLKGVELEPIEEADEPKVVDLMEALKRSLGEGGGRKERKGSGGGATIHQLKPKPKTAKKKAAKRTTTRRRKRG